MTRAFKTIVADPPWHVKAGRPPGGEGFTGTAQATRRLDYPSMQVEEICALPIGDLASDDAHLYLWTINRYVEEAFAVARAWGFRYSTLLTWAKKPMGAGLGGSWGISTEHVLFCLRGKDISHGRHAGTSFSYKRPYDERGKPKHSAKPPEFLDDIERVSPGPYLDLFSRAKAPRLGWDYHGDESLNTVQLAVSGGEDR